VGLSGADLSLRNKEVGERERSGNTHGESLRLNVNSNLKGSLSVEQAIPGLYTGQWGANGKREIGRELGF
jgi:hypothetical protein